MLPTNLTTLASDSEANRLYHEELHAALPWLGLPTSITPGATGHRVTHHPSLHAAVDRGLRKGTITDATVGHGADHNILHAYANTTYQHEYHVTKTGSDSGGTLGTWADPLLSVSAAVTRAMADNAAGQTVRIRVHPTASGTPTYYREQVIITTGGTSAAMILEGADDGVIISGGDLIGSGSWTDTGANRIYWMTWTNNWGVQAWPGGWPVLGTDEMRRREIVLVDGVWIRQVLTQGALTSYDSAYYVDEAADRLYVRLPTGETLASAAIEVAMRDRCFQATGRTGLEVRGLTFQQAATPMQQHAVEFAGGSAPVMEDCAVKFASWSGLGCNSNGFISRRNSLWDNGIVGALVYQGHNHLWEDGDVRRNNQYRGLWAGYQDWEDGGTKYLDCNTTTMRRMTYRDQKGPQCWFDTANTNVTVEDSSMAGGTSYGFFSEQNNGPITFRRNKVNANFRGMKGANTRNLTLDDNEFWDNNVEWSLGVPSGAGVIVDGLNTDPRDWVVTNNLFWASSAGGQRRIDSPYDMTDATWNVWKSTLTASGNAYHSTAEANPFVIRNGTGTPEVFTTFTGWKTELGGSRDSTSTFSSSAPSPPPSL